MPDSGDADSVGGCSDIVCGTMREGGEVMMVVEDKEGERIQGPLRD